MKRLLDIIASAIGLLMLLPLFIVVIYLIKQHDGGPIFYYARRVGKGGQEFAVYKFRSMVVDADRQGAAVTISSDDRITPIGKFLRDTKLDELPQLLNVLKGEMSLVGPRPEDPRYVEKYTPQQRRILDYPPGITSAASLTYRNEESLLSGDDWETQYLNQIMPDKLAIDLEYCDRANIGQDLILILKTIFSMFA